MKEELELYVKKVKEKYEFCMTNEAVTRSSLIAPLFTLLGWDMTDPKECMPEYRADFGRGEKAATPVDWAFATLPTFAFIVEAKDCSKKLKLYAEQLGMYFAKTSVKLGIYTNGIHWQFYTDLDNQNIMDKTPFLSWDILNGDPIPYDFLTLLQKSQFKPQLIRTFAERGRRQSLLVTSLTKLLEPAADFIKLAVRDIETRSLHASVIEEWKPILVNAINEWAKIKALDMALEGPTLEKKTKKPKPAPVELEEKINKSQFIRNLLEKRGVGVTYSEIQKEMEAIGVNSSMFNVIKHKWKHKDDSPEEPDTEDAGTVPFKEVV